jgi:DNA-binding response OmpR family regulator
MEKLLLLVDDDRMPMQFYVKALEKQGFNVRHCLTSDEALEYAEKEKGNIAGIILDIMLPPGRYKNTNEGLRTGVPLLEDLRRYCADTPVIVLTNVRNPKTLDEFKGKPLVIVVQKMECPPFELAKLVEDMSG